MFSSLKAASQSIIDSIIEIAYYMRGAIQYEDLMWRTPGERDRFVKFITKRLKDQAKSPYPVY